MRLPDGPSVALTPLVSFSVRFLRNGSGLLWLFLSPGPLCRLLWWYQKNQLALSPTAASMERPVRSIHILCSTDVVERVPWSMFDSKWYGSNKWSTKIPIDVTFLTFQTIGEARNTGKFFTALDYLWITRFGDEFKKDVANLMQLVGLVVDKHSDGFMIKCKHPKVSPPLASFYNLCANQDIYRGLDLNEGEAWLAACGGDWYHRGRVSQAVCGNRSDGVSAVIIGDSAAHEGSCRHGLLANV
ncbi:hypothetical protein RHSIM_Rhsim02G0056000 [Rhododendron simsii]|uniref:Uncharacterized protein n=1 Tax=Rhododendron simsii TaxID=118357 RepID=A0A834HBE6_RHOSS|nr:hypothetical protein RHSIM_Rhsim02G0056000 [Rhododendron simsii]